LDETFYDITKNNSTFFVQLRISRSNIIVGINRIGLHYILQKLNMLTSKKRFLEVKGYLVFILTYMMLIQRCLPQVKLYLLIHLSIQPDRMNGQTCIRDFELIFLVWQLSLMMFRHLNHHSITKNIVIWGNRKHYPNKVTWKLQTQFDWVYTWVIKV
jgi:hypothetical protein